MSSLEAAEYTGFAPNTLKKYGLNGKLKMYKSPLTGYALYKQEDLDKFVEEMKPKEYCHDKA